MEERLREKRLHGTPVFPFEYILMETQNNSIFVPCHWHDEAEIIVVTNGQVEFIADGTRYVLSENDIVFGSPQQMHQYASLSDVVVYDACIFSLKQLLFSEEDMAQKLYIEPIINGKLRFPIYIPSNDPLNPKIRQIYRKMLDDFEKKENGWELSVKICLYEIIYTLIKNERMTSHEGIEKDAYTCKKILEYLDKNLCNEITVNDISRHICMSPNYFSAYFTKHFGRSFTKYLINLRIERACILLLTTDQTITEIAVSVGFDNTSYFIRKFKEFSGCTPKEYRKNKEKNELSNESKKD